MKKNILKIGLLTVLTLGTATTLNSCRDAIDITQDGEVYPEVFFTSVSNLSKFLPTVYNMADTSGAIFITSLLTDEVKVGSSNGGNQIAIYRLVIDPDNGYSYSLWLGNNMLIGYANRLLEGAKNITPTTDAEKEQYNKIIAEARVLRAFAHMQHLTYFSENMKDDNQLGSMLFDYVPNVSTKIGRSTNAEVFKAIEEDLNFAYDKLDKASRYRVSQSMVDAMRARIALYRGKYAEAGVYAQKAIDNSGLSLTTALPIPSGTVGSKAWNSTFYGDASPSPYRQIWSDNLQGEVIFALARPVTGGSYTNLSSYYNTNRSEITGSPKWVMGYSLFNILKSTNGDIRRYAYVDPTSTITNNTADDIIIDKYPGKSTAPLRNDLKVFRISEMKFILAEAAVEAGDLTKARDIIQEIRVARNYKGTATTPTYTTKQEALQDILKERRVELAYEGHRYIDLKRRGADAGLASTDRNSLDDSGATVENLSINDYRFTLPIPSQEMSVNPKMIQNKGY